MESNDTLFLRARQTENWGHAGNNRSRVRNDFVTLYRSDWDTQEGVRRVDVARLICIMRLTVPGLTSEFFDVVYVDNWKRREYSERFRCYKYISSANLSTGAGFSIERVSSIFRPVHMTPNWNVDLGQSQSMYLNSKVDVHGWMNFY